MLEFYFWGLFLCLFPTTKGWERAANGPLVPIAPFVSGNVEQKRESLCLCSLLIRERALLHVGVNQSSVHVPLGGQVKFEGSLVLFEVGWFLTDVSLPN